MNTRAQQALDLRRSGVSLKNIGKEFGVTKQRARQMVVLGLEIERVRQSGDIWYELSPRARNAMTTNGCDPTPNGVVEFFKWFDWKRLPAFGKKCFAELNAWLIRHGKEPLT